MLHLRAAARDAARGRRRKAGSPLLTGLLYYWTMDETSGSRVDSVAGLALAVGGGAPGYAAGKQGNAADFEQDAGDYLTTSTVVQMTGDWTYALWVKPESYPSAGTYHMIWKAGGVWGDGGGPRIMLAYNNAMACLFYKGNNNDSTVTHASAMGGAGVWSFVLFTHDSVAKEVRAWTNASAKSPGTYTFAPVATIQPLALGGPAVAGSPTWDGLIDEVGLWNRVLSEAEIGLLYNSGSGLTYPFA